MRTVRLWFDDLEQIKEGERLRLDREESHHFSTVLRGRVGDEVELMNGEGLLVKALCHETSSKAAHFETREIKRCRLLREVHVVSPLPKGKRLPYMMEKLQEVGVRYWSPMVTEHSVRDELSSHQAQKLEERAKEACKQSGSPFRLKIKSEMSFSTCLEQAGVVMLDIGGKSWSEPTEELSSLLLLVGPEAGWSDGERQNAVDRGVMRMGLSPFHLRMETAAMIGAARVLESSGVS